MPRRHRAQMRFGSPGEVKFCGRRLHETIRSGSKAAHQPVRVIKEGKGDPAEKNQSHGQGLRRKTVWVLAVVKVNSSVR